MANTVIDHRKRAGFWFIQIPGWIFLIYLLYAQGIPAFNYDAGVAMGTQNSVDEVTEVGVAFWRGFAVSDVLTYIPLLALGLIGHYKNKNWGRILLAAAFGISVYWPVTCLVAVNYAQDAPGWNFPIPTIYWIVLGGVILWSVYGLWRLVGESSGRYAGHPR